MKYRFSVGLGAVTLIAALTVPAWLAAQDTSDKPKHHHYKLIDMGTFGGPESYILPTPANGQSQPSK